jgi:prepilin-type N-terminal cleavage/methylation domain-containing protein
MKSPKKSKGFTLIELLIVVLIVGVALFALKSCTN